MIGGPLLILGLLLVLTALLGGRIEARRWGAVAGFLLSPLTPAAWRATGSIILGFGVELVGFTTVVTIFSTGGSLLVVGIGFLLLGLGIEASRLVARAERWRVSLADPRPLAAHAYRPYGSGLRDLLMAVFLDVNRWRDVIYVFIAFPLTVLELMASMLLWALAIGLLGAPPGLGRDRSARLHPRAAGQRPVRDGRHGACHRGRPGRHCPGDGRGLAPRVVCSRSTGPWSPGCCARTRPAGSNGVSRRSRAAVGPFSTSRRASCDGSSATSTTARSSGWWC